MVAHRYGVPVVVGSSPAAPTSVPAHLPWARGCVRCVARRPLPPAHGCAMMRVQKGTSCPAVCVLSFGALSQHFCTGSQSLATKLEARLAGILAADQRGTHLPRQVQKLVGPRHSRGFFCGSACGSRTNLGCDLRSGASGTGPGQLRARREERGAPDFDRGSQAGALSFASCRRRREPALPHVLLL